jgi:hypothetical protein
MEQSIRLMDSIISKMTREFLRKNWIKREKSGHHDNFVEAEKVYNTLIRS